MFSDEILNEILQMPDVRNVPVVYRSDVIRAVAEVLEKRNLIKGDE